MTFQYMLNKNKKEIIEWILKESLWRAIKSGRGKLK